MTITLATVILFIPVISAIWCGSILLRKACHQSNRLPEAFALAGAFVFLVGSLFWLGVYLTHSSFLGFRAPWTWLTAAHFAVAGFGALTITALSCRVVSNRISLYILRWLLILHPVAYLMTAAGILGYRLSDDISSVLYFVLFLVQFLSVLRGHPHRMSIWPYRLLLLALAIPIITMIPAISWAWDHPILDIKDMVHYHGLINALGHVLLGWIAFAWGRPPCHTRS